MRQVFLFKHHAMNAFVAFTTITTTINEELLPSVATTHSGCIQHHPLSLSILGLLPQAGTEFPASLCTNPRRLNRHHQHTNIKITALDSTSKHLTALHSTSHAGTAPQSTAFSTARTTARETSPQQLATQSSPHGERSRSSSRGRSSPSATMVKGRDHDERAAAADARLEVACARSHE